MFVISVTLMFINSYFRYKERDDHCAKCAEENSRDLYEECSLLCPSPTPSFQEPPVIDVTTEEPITTSTTSLDPLVIVGIVVLLIFLLVIAVVALVLCLPQKSLRRCFDFCGHRYKPVPDKKNDCNSCPNEEAKLTSICDPEVTIGKGATTFMILTRLMLVDSYIVCISVTQ